MPEPKGQERARHEDLLRVELVELFGEQADEALELIDAGLLDDPFWNKEEQKWNDRLRPIFLGAVFTSFLLDMARGFGGVAEPPQDYREFGRSEASNYVEGYLGITIADITNTTRTSVNDALVDYVLDPELSLDDLAATLQATVFSQSRIEGITATEITRAMYEGENAFAAQLREAGFEYVRYWYTVNDERVCPICGPLHGLPETPEGGWDPSGVGPGIFPDAHINCRCGIITEIT